MYFLVQDKLREMLLNDDSENSGLYSEGEKNEFLFHLLRLCCRGGSMMQAEITFSAYKDMVKTLYKDFVTVQRGVKSGKIEITSSVWKISSGNCSLFPNNSRHNDAFVILDDAQHLATIIYKTFKSFW